MESELGSPRLGRVEPRPVTTELTRPLLLLMAAACGMAVANLYYNQPLLPQIGRSIEATERQLGLLPMLTQAGFALGVFLLAPLGDTTERRRLILIMLGLVTVSLAGAAVSPNLACLAVASFAIGITSVISTQVLPFAVSLARPEERGKTVGTIASAMLMGVLLSRTLSGFIGEHFGWRAMYGLACALMVGLAILMKTMLPASRPSVSLPYPRLLLSMWHLTREYPLLRQATLNGILLYGSLSAFWATLVFQVEGPNFHYGPAATGMFGLVAALGAMGAPLAGKWADSRSARTLVGFAAVSMFAGFLILWGFGEHLAGLIAGVIVLDLGAQIATVSNQATVYSLAPEAQSRMYTVYRACYSLGGSAGAYGGVWAWSLWGWSGVCGFGLSLLAVALGCHWWANRGEIMPVGLEERLVPAVAE